MSSPGPAPPFSRSESELEPTISINTLVINDNEKIPLISENVEVVDITKKDNRLSAMQLMILAYFWTCGGPFGIEAAVGAAGAALTALTILAICLMWALPQALMSAELSLMINVNGGNIIWAQAAFGDFVGFVNAGCYLASSLSSQALLVILFTDYIDSANGVTLTLPLKYAARTLFVIVCTFANIWGIKWLARLSWFILVIIFSPFVTQIIATVVLKKPVDYKGLIAIPPLSEVNWGLLISTTVWSFGGFDAMGSVAGEVRGKSTFMKGILGAFPLCLVNYLFPIFAGFIVNNNRMEWQSSGYFTVIAFQFFPSWLGILMVTASAISNFGQLTSGMSSLSWTMWAMAKGRKDDVALHRYLPYFFSWSWNHSKSGVVRPVSAIIANSVLSLLVSIFPFSFVVQLYLVVRIANLATEYAALIWLRFIDPDRPRPFKVPGGKVGAILLCLPSACIAGLALWTADDWRVPVTGFATITVIAACYPLKKFWVWVTHKVYVVLSRMVT